MYWSKSSNYSKISLKQQGEKKRGLALGAKHLELERRPHIHNKALELRAMWRNVQMPQTGLSLDPSGHTARPPPPCSVTAVTPSVPLQPSIRQFSTCSRLIFNSPLHGSHWAVDIWRCGRRCGPTLLHILFSMATYLRFSDCWIAPVQHSHPTVKCNKFTLLRQRVGNLIALKCWKLRFKN